MLDKAGTLIKPGDFIVYGQALGRCASLNYARVTDVGESKDEYNKHPTCRVVGVTASFSRGLQLQKPATLHFSERILVVTPQQMDFASFSLLNSVDY